MALSILVDVIAARAKLIDEQTAYLLRHQARERYLIASATILLRNSASGMRPYPARTLSRTWAGFAVAGMAQ
jgi:hypothetical protein